MNVIGNYTISCLFYLFLFYSSFAAILDYLEYQGRDSELIFFVYYVDGYFGLSYIFFVAWLCIRLVAMCSLKI